MAGKRYTQKKKEDALKHSERHSLKETSAKFGIPIATLTSWRHKARNGKPASNGSGRKRVSLLPAATPGEKEEALLARLAEIQANRQQEIDAAVMEYVT